MEPTQNTPTKPKIRVAIFDDDFDIRDGIGGLFRRAEDLEFIGAEAQANGIEAFIKDRKPDVILMDISMPPGINGIRATELAKKADPNVNVVILTTHTEDEKVFEALKNGAIGYLLKASDKDRVLDAIRTAAAGGSMMNETIARKAIGFFQKLMKGEEKETADYNLTKQENRVLECLCEGMSSKMVGAALGIAPDTVRSHMRNIYEKMHVKSKTQAVLLAMKHKRF